MSLHRSLFFTMIFITILALAFRLESRLVTDERMATNQMVQAIQYNNRVRQEANIYSTVQNTFSRFRDLVSNNHMALFRYGWAPDFVEKSLPPYSLAIAIADGKGNLLNSADLRGETNPEFLARFLAIDDLKTRNYKEDVFFNPKYEELCKECDDLLHEYIGDPVDKIVFMQMRAGRMATFRSAERCVGVYWDKLTVANGQLVYFFCRIDLHKMSALHVFKTIAETESVGNFAAAFFDGRSGEFVAGNSLQIAKKKSETDYVNQVCRDFIGKAGNNRHMRTEMFRHGSLAVVIGREVTGTPFFPVVIARLQGLSDARSTQIYRLLAFAGVCLVFLVFVQTVVFGRGLKLSVGKVLILASLFAIFMPFMMGRSIFQLILREASASERLKIERNLHNTLTGIDSGIRLYNANLFQSFLKSFAHPDTIRSLKEAREQQALYENSPAERANIDLKAHDQDVLNIAERAFAPFISSYKTSGDPGRRANAILVMGPNGFLRYYDRFKREVVGHSAESRNDSMFMLLNMYRKTIEKFFARDEFVPGLLESKKTASAEAIEKAMYDEIKKHIITSFGNERFYEIFSRLEGLSSMRTSVGTTLFTVFPLRIGGLIEYFCGVGWDEYAIGESYLKNAFAEIINVNNDSRKLVSLLDIFDPAAFIAADPVLVQAFSGFRAESFFSQDTESPRLSTLIRSASRNRRITRYVGTGDEKAIYQALPGRYLGLYTVGGRQDTSYLDRIEFWRSVIFMSGLIVFLIFAVLAAINISRSFTGPLEHLLWGLNCIEAGNYEVKLKDSREDEFGSISRAFNRMVKGLRERNALGSFVSESVRRLASNPELFEKARQGSEAKFTILFADFDGFSEFATTADEKAVQRKLEFSLERFFRYADEYGGEVDKVVGEKLLIVFSHERHGKKNAAVAAIKLAKRILHDFKADPDIKPVFGINSGRVISGIIGTPEVRIDNTVIGDPVNVAARMCSLANSESMPIIISGAVRDCLGSSYPVKPVSIERIRGKKQEVEVFNLVV
ncbi:MAG: Adenylate cyclase [Candidatus Rifleibacterium amylolyticum]|nr:MAG: Adenylate cyclase [Candidatus Rifleibacterium amylolyticum]